MSFFTYKDQILHAEQVAIPDLVERFGSPCYVYSKAALLDRYQAYRQSLPAAKGLICYAVKANANLAVLQCLAAAGAGFDIVSQGELERVLAAGGDPQKVVFSGVGKLAGEMRRALQVGVHCFNVESAAELERLNQVAGEEKIQAPVSIRVNPNVDAQTHPYISTGLKENKFGIDITLAEQVCARAEALPNLKLIGIDCHIGSQLTDTQPFLDAFASVLQLADQLRNSGVELQHIDVGGGLGVCYQNETPPDPADYVQALLAQLNDRPYQLILEPGRSIAANAGVFITQVEYIKSNDVKNFAIVDGAMNDLIRPSLYQAWQGIIEVAPNPELPALNYEVVGPVCETGDFLGKDRTLKIQAGDLLAVQSAGAYGFVMSSNYNSRNRVAEIMVDGQQYQLVRRRETYQDQLALEQLD